MCDAVLGAFTWNGPYALLRIQLDPIGTKYLVATLAGKEQQFDGGAERRSLFVENIPEDSDLLVGKDRSAEHTSELRSLIRFCYAVYCMNEKQPDTHDRQHLPHTH